MNTALHSKLTWSHTPPVSVILLVVLGDEDKTQDSRGGFPSRLFDNIKV